MSDIRPTIAWDLEAQLGEGPVWVERDRALWFVDIKKHQVHRFAPENGEKRSWDSPEPVGFLFPAERGGFVAGLKSGLYHFDETTGAFDLIAEVEADKPTNRLNDGVVDPHGRLWFGTMDNDEKAKTGAFYRFADGEVRTTALTGIAISNGPAVSPDGRLLYHVDTLKGTIERSEIRDDGSLGESRPFVRIDPKGGHPDGPTIDSEGCLWIALYGGWAARRYSPEGELVGEVRFPAANITKLAFGGDDLRTGFASSARQKLTGDQLASQPDAGDLFQFRAAIAGVPSPLVRF
jgi:sugar lactone lactonase YvrE